MKDQAVLRPEDESQLAEAVAGAAGPLRILGGGTRPMGAPVAGTALSVAGLSGITLYEPGALTLVARAGTPLAEVEAALAAEGQRLPFEPMDHRGLLGTSGTPTIGAVAAGNISGPRRIQAGACRDSLIGVRFVTGEGQVIKNGGRVMKNVTGYDLVKLLAGSWGTLGVLSEVSFKVLPETAHRAVLRIDGLSVAEGIGALARALGSPYEVSGAAHLPEGPDGGPVTLLRVEGSEAMANGRAEKLRALLGHGGAVETDPDRTGGDWTWIRDAGLFHGTDEDVWRISVTPSDGVRVAAALPEARLIFDWGGGLVWAGVAPGTDLRPALAGIPGHATLIRASEATRAAIAPFPPEPAPIRQISEGLRRKFDPRGILNPGLMG